MRPNLRVPPLSYGLSRDITAWPWLAPAVYLIAIVSFAILIVLNVALTGYDVVITQQPSFNATQKHWYDRFAGPETPGTLCSSYNFSLGETFSTSNTILSYTLLAGTGNNQTVSYSGSGLDSCDVSYLTLDADLLARTAHTTAYLVCNSTELTIVAKSAFVGSYLQGVSTVADSSAVQYALSRYSAVWINQGIQEAMLNLLDQIEAVATGPNPVTVISIWAYPNCPIAELGSSSGACTSSTSATPVQWSFFWSTGLGYMGLSNGSAVASVPNNITNEYSSHTGSNFESRDYPYPTTLTSLYTPALANVVQIIHAAVRLDLGNVYPNNVIQNWNTTKSSTLYEAFPSASGAAGITPSVWNSSWLSDSESIGTYPPGAFLNAEYNCQFSYPKSWGSALIAVMVATLSLFNTGWGLALMLIAFFVTRAPEANHCDGCVAARSGYAGTPQDEKAAEAGFGAELQR